MPESVPAKDILCLTSRHRGDNFSQQIVYDGECMVKQRGAYKIEINILDKYIFFKSTSAILISDRLF